jgi:hypothetical protein
LRHTAEVCAEPREAVAAGDVTLDTVSVPRSAEPRRNGETQSYPHHGLRLAGPEWPARFKSGVCREKVRFVIQPWPHPIANIDRSAKSGGAGS